MYLTNSSSPEVTLCMRMLTCFRNSMNGLFIFIFPQPAAECRSATFARKTNFLRKTAGPLTRTALSHDWCDLLHTFRRYASHQSPSGFDPSACLTPRDYPASRLHP